MYLLIREKKGISPEDRLEHLFMSKLFDTLKSLKSHVMDKVTAMAGDIDQPELGLCSGDQDKVLTKVGNLHSDCEPSMVVGLKLSVF